MCEHVKCIVCEKMHEVYEIFQLILSKKESSCMNVYFYFVQNTILKI